MAADGGTAAAAAVIEATSQLSRFHLETLETGSTALQLQTVNLSVGDKLVRRRRGAGETVRSCHAAAAAD